MIGNGILAFAVIFIVVVFVYLSLKMQNNDPDKRNYTETYRIELKNGFAGDSLSVYLNDSLLLNTCMPDSAIVLTCYRLSEQNALLIVDNRTEQISTFNLSEKGGKVTLNKTNGVTYMLGNE